MMNEPLDLKALSKPFPPEEIEWRVGSTNSEKTKGLALAYLTSRHVMDRFDEVCGQEGWQCNYTETPRGRILCTISVKVGSDWISKSDGAGETDVEGDKGAISDALKRAAVPWGVGRYLYNLKSIWVAIEPMGRSFKIKDSEKPKLIASLNDGVFVDEQPQWKETKYPLKEDDRRKLWARMMDDLQGEAPKGSDAMIRYMQHPDTQRDLATLEPWRDRFRREAADMIKVTKEAEEAIGENVASIKPLVAPSFDNLEP